MEELISIIVPIYNVEEYLERCIQSLIRQTYSKIEILLIDDGSTDNCGKICDSYEVLDNRIRVFHKKNGGLSDARNYGIERCSGRYISFVDSDDYVADNYIELLYSILEKYSADITICASQYIYDKSFKQELVDGENIREYSSKDAIVDTLNIKISQRAWGKLYKRELFEKTRFPVGKLYEDLAVAYDLLLESSMVVYTDAPAYYYLIRSGSIMQSKFNIKHAEELEIIDEAMDKVVNNYPDLKKLANSRRIYSYFVVLRRVLLSDNPDEYKDLRKDIRNRVRYRSKGLLHDTKISRNIRVKLLLYKFGEKPYMMLQKIADKRNPEASLK